MNEKMNKQLEMLESNIRRDIRQGWSSLKIWSLWCLQASLLLILKVSVMNTQLTLNIQLWCATLPAHLCTGTQIMP